MRSIFKYASVFIILVIAGLAFLNLHFLWLFIVVLPLVGMGVYDMNQKKHSLTSNFPLVGRLRWVAEWMRPKMFQYFIESDTSGTPFNRLSRNVVYQRSKKVNDTVPFGTQYNVYDVGYEWLNHSILPLPHSELNFNPRIDVGGPDCKQPYSSSVFNISAMSYGSLSKNAIMALNKGAFIGGFSHNTGEGGLSPFHLANGGDIVWQIGTGYFGCRNIDGSFNYDSFAERAVMPNVKMIEIKLSQGAKPGHGGILPAAKVSKEIAAIRLVEEGKDVISPPYHTAFSDPEGLLFFIKKLRELSQGKPIGFKLCIGQKKQFIAVVKAMMSHNIMPDFITVDGGEGGTGAAPQEFSNSVGMPLRDALAFVFDTLHGFGIKRHIKIVASGKVHTGFDLVKNFALGADICTSARAMMLSLGCIQALECNKNTCPVGVATQDEKLYKGLDIGDKSVRVANFHHETIKATVELMAAAGIDHPHQLHRSHIYKRINASQIQTYSEMYPHILKGALLEGPYPIGWELDMANSTEKTFVQPVR